MSKFWDVMKYNPMTYFGQLAYKAYKTARNVFENVENKYAGTGLTDTDRDKIKLEDEYADENADVAFERQKWMQENYLSPAAQIRSTAEGYEEVGINKMAMAGTNPGASSANVPQSEGGSVTPQSGDLLGHILNFVMRGAQLKEEVKLRNRDIDVKEDYNKALAALATSQKEGKDIENQFAPQILSGKVEELTASVNALKDQLNNNRVQRELWRQEIKTSEAVAALNRAQAWLTSINSRIATADANTRAQFDFLQNQFLYWSVQSAKVQGQFAERMAKKQLSFMSHQIALLAEQKYGTMVNYLNGYELYKQSKFTTKHQGISYWNDLIAGDLETVGKVAGTIFGFTSFGKMAGAAGQPSSLILRQEGGTYTPKPMEPLKDKFGRPILFP